MKLLRIIRWTAFVLIFALAGFYASVLLRPEPATITTIAEPGSAAHAPALTLPEFTLTDVAGKPRSIAEFTGRPLLINFWATWCTPCLREMPMFEAVWQERIPKHSLQIVGIAIDRSDDVAAYLKHTDVTYPILIGQADAMEAANSFGPDYVGLPFTIFVAADGQILLSHSGELLREQLDDILTTVDAVAGRQISIADARAQLAR